MEFTIQNFVKSGAVRHICYYAASECGEPVDWAKVKEYIGREFRDASDIERNNLLLCSQVAYEDACKLNVRSNT
jgi:hypothetical protein